MKSIVQDSSAFKRRIFPLALAFLISPFSGFVFASSFQNEVYPIFQAKCVGCHSQAKASGKLILTDFDSIIAGGKRGSLINAEDPDSSLLLQYVIGDPPLMPIQGDPLTEREVDAIREWIKAGAPDDRAPDDRVPTEESSPTLNQPFVYHNAPVISALAFSPDGKHVAVSGYREILIWTTDGKELAARLPGRADRINSIAYSPDGTIVAAVGGSPSQFGEIQFWYVPTRQLLRSSQISHDTLFGASFSPDGKWVAFGAVDKKARIVSCPFGAVLVEFENHDDWVFASAFTLDGKHLVTGSKDKSIKLINAESGSFIDDINASNKGYGSVQSVNRHPAKDWVVIAGDDGVSRLYKVFRTQRRDRPNTDFNLLREYPRVDGGVNVVRFSPDGSLIAAGGTQGMLHVFDSETGDERFQIRGDSVSIFSLEFHPEGRSIAFGGFDGTITIIDSKTGDRLDQFTPVPMQTALANESRIGK